MPTKNKSRDMDKNRVENTSNVNSDERERLFIIIHDIHISLDKIQSFNPKSLSISKLLSNFIDSFSYKLSKIEEIIFSNNKIDTPHELYTLLSTIYSKLTHVTDTNSLKEDILHENLVININDIIVLLDIAFNITLTCQYESLSKLLSKIKEFDAFLEDKNLRNRISSFENQIKILEEKSEDNQKIINKNFKDTKEYLNQQGLSASFSDRSTNLNSHSMIWLSVLSFFALLFLGLTIDHIPNIDRVKNIYDVQIFLWKYLIYTPFAITSFWLIWFCSKNYFYTSRLRDNYNFKNDLSKAFYGYHKEAMELNDDQNILLKQLLGGLIANICDNPVKENKEDHSSPVTEILSQVCKITNVKDKVDGK